MSLATSANGPNLTCRPVERMSADKQGLNGLGTDVASGQFMTRLRNRQAVTLFSTLPISRGRRNPARFR